MNLKNLRERLQMLAVFRSLLKDPVIEALIGYLACRERHSELAAGAYGRFVNRLYQTEGGDLARHVLRCVEEDENVYIRAVGRGETPPDYMARSVEAELKTLQLVASLTPEDLAAGLLSPCPLPQFGTSALDLPSLYWKRLNDIGRRGWGIYARHHMFYLEDDGQIVPVRHPDATRLSDLVDYERERKLIYDNTLALLAGKPAANVLLTGDAGTGKSSTVKAVANEMWQEGLRVIEVRPAQLRLIPALLDELSENPLKFILFIDDLSFQKGDDSYSALKAVLEGSVSAKSRNVAVYATSNRRHLVKETFSDRDGDDLHRTETMQEQLSLSERFGLRVSFQKPDKATYLHIVTHLARAQGITLPEEDLHARAERFALERGARSARCARQFVEGLEAGL